MYCYSTKCGLIFAGILLWLYCFIEIVNIIWITNNENFDPIYGQVYLICVIILVIASILFFIYLVIPDCPTGRAFLPWVFLIAFFGAILICFWILIYICFIYKKDKVYVDAHER